MQVALEALRLAVHSAEVAGDDDAAALVVQAGQRLVELVERRLSCPSKKWTSSIEQHVEVAVAGAEGGAGLRRARRW